MIPSVIEIIILAKRAIYSTLGGKELMEEAAKKAAIGLKTESAKKFYIMLQITKEISLLR